MQQADGDGAGLATKAGVVQRIGDRIDACDVEGGVDGAVGAQAFVDLEAQVPWREGPRQVEVQVVHVVAVFARNLDGVAEAAGRHEGGAVALPFNEGIGDESGAVDDGGEVAGGRARTHEGLGEGGRDAARGVVGGGQDLAEPRAARVLVVGEEEVGEGPADVDSDAPPGWANTGGGAIVGVRHGRQCTRVVREWLRKGPPPGRNRCRTTAGPTEMHGGFDSHGNGLPPAWPRGVGSVMANTGRRVP